MPDNDTLDGEMEDKYPWKVERCQRVGYINNTAKGANYAKS